MSQPFFSFPHMKIVHKTWQGEWETNTAIIKLYYDRSFCFPIYHINLTSFSIYLLEHVTKTATYWGERQPGPPTQTLGGATGPPAPSFPTPMYFTGSVIQNTSFSYSLQTINNRKLSSCFNVLTEQNVANKN